MPGADEEESMDRPDGIVRARRFILTIVNAGNGERHVTLGDR